VEIKGQLDEIKWFLLKNLLSAQHVSGTIMPIIRSSRVIQMVAACSTWRFGLQVVGLAWSCRLCVQVAGSWRLGVYVCVYRVATCDYFQCMYLYSKVCKDCLIMAN